MKNGGFSVGYSVGTNCFTESFVLVRGEVIMGVDYFCPRPITYLPRRVALMITSSEKVFRYATHKVRNSFDDESLGPDHHDTEGKKVHIGVEYVLKSHFHLYPYMIS